MWGLRRCKFGDELSQLPYLSRKRLKWSKRFGVKTSEREPLKFTVNALKPKAQQGKLQVLKNCSRALPGRLHNRLQEAFPGS